MRVVNFWFLDTDRTLIFKSFTEQYEFFRFVMMYNNNNNNNNTQLETFHMSINAVLVYVLEYQYSLTRCTLVARVASKCL